jgi:hypothetical protein
MIKLKDIIKDDKIEMEKSKIPILEKIEPPKCDLITRLRQRQECEDC